MKGICHIWSRGRYFSPSLPDVLRGERYLKPGSQKRPTGRNLGGNRLVRRSGTKRGTAFLTFCLHMRSLPIPGSLTTCVGINIRIGSSKYSLRRVFLKYVHENLNEAFVVLKILHINIWPKVLNSC